jgi:hypothetical protein
MSALAHGCGSNTSTADFWRHAFHGQDSSKKLPVSEALKEYTRSATTSLAGSKGAENNPPQVPVILSD